MKVSVLLTPDFIPLLKLVHCGLTHTLQTAIFNWFQYIGLNTIRIKTAVQMSSSPIIPICILNISILIWTIQKSSSIQIEYVLMKQVIGHRPSAEIKIVAWRFKSHHSPVSKPLNRRLQSRGKSFQYFGSGTRRARVSRVSGGHVSAPRGFAFYYFHNSRFTITTGKAFRTVYGR